MIKNRITCAIKNIFTEHSGFEIYIILRDKISEQQKIIEDIRKSNGIIKEDLFQVRARNYFKKLEKSSKKGKRLIKKLERSRGPSKRLIEKATASSIIRK